MMDLLWPPTRAMLFSMDAENAHDLTLSALERAPGLFASLVGARARPVPELARTVAGLQLTGPVGLAAGLDKDARALTFWPALGFGFVEVGTVTAIPQQGNPRPRLFRIPGEHALLNRMGFNNRGSEAMATRLRALREAGKWPSVPVGVNLGKSKVTPLDEAPADYALSTRRLHGLADYFTVNVSSPNTPGLRSLQDQDALSRLLPAVLAEADSTPVFLKLAPDLTAEAIHEAVELAHQHGIAGIIASNTTIRRDMLAGDPGEAGGLSGRPLRPLAMKCIRAALAAAAGRLPVIGVGGIESAQQVENLLEEGCAAVQLYSALIYSGPGLPGRLNAELARQ
ncbi:MAG: dihydroorotate dehydrogenase [Myxococcota bacterium]|jgi:dihydroorotate dehydrogenase